MKKHKGSPSQEASCAVKDRFTNGNQAYRASKKGQRIYRCPCCRGFHLTSQKTKGKPHPRKLNPKQEAE